MKKINVDDLGQGTEESLTEDEIRKIRGGASFSSRPGVTIELEAGELRQPYVIGSLWSGKDAPPTEK